MKSCINCGGNNFVLEPCCQMCLSCGNVDCNGSADTIIVSLKRLHKNFKFVKNIETDSCLEFSFDQPFVTCVVKLQ